jgi:hypothetical protein
LAWALENGVTDGVWGATTPEERSPSGPCPGRTTTSQEDDGGEGYQPAEHAEQEIRTQAAQGKATRISAALELAIAQARRELRSRETQREVSASEVVAFCDRWKVVRGRSQDAGHGPEGHQLPLAPSASSSSPAWAAAEAVDRSGDGNDPVVETNVRFRR